MDKELNLSKISLAENINYSSDKENKSLIGTAEGREDKQGIKKIFNNATTQTSEQVFLNNKSEKSLMYDDKNNLCSTEKPKLCNECSKSMLFYITSVQNFLEDIAKEICRNTDHTTIQCSEVTKAVLNSKHELKNESEEIVSVVRVKKKIGGTPSSTSNSHGSKKPNSDFSGTELAEENPRRTQYKKSTFQHRETTLVQETLGEHSNQETPYREMPPCGKETTDEVSDKSSSDIDIHTHVQAVETDRSLANFQTERKSYVHDHSLKFTLQRHSEENVEGKKCSKSIGGNIDQERILDRISANFQTERKSYVHDHSEKFTLQRHSGENVEENKSSESIGDNNDQERILEPSLYVYDDFNNTYILTSQYDSKYNNKDVELQLCASEDEILNKVENIVDEHRMRDEAFVTLARNNADALGCLVLGSSLIRSGTKKTLCVLVSDNVSGNFLTQLSLVFDVVRRIRSLDSLGSTQLALLDQPSLGISFMKLNVWRLSEFTKCVYMNYDTMVVQNCDELFDHEELSAVPDIGWPDCFNNAVFVFQPSTTTFWKLLVFAEEQTSYDGGDQGIMNAFFSNWSEDIHKKLSFIYNLMANVSYGYTPAFRQFGQNVKVVQFIGTLKPWHVKFCNKTGELSSSSVVHPTYLRFVHLWLHIFITEVLPNFSEEIQNYVSSRDTLSPDEILQFFPSSPESDFLLSPPSVRLHPCDHFQGQVRSGQKSINTVSCPSTSSTSDGTDKFDIKQQEFSTESSEKKTAEVENVDVGKITNVKESEIMSATDAEKNGAEEEGASSSVIEKEDSHDKKDDGGKDTGCDDDIPESSLGNYQGMVAWEQGRIDYQGSDKSDKIIKRLQFLIQNRPDSS